MIIFFKPYLLIGISRLATSTSPRQDNNQPHINDRQTSKCHREVVATSPVLIDFTTFCLFLANFLMFGTSYMQHVSGTITKTSIFQRLMEFCCLRISQEVNGSRNSKSV